MNKMKVVLVTSALLLSAASAFGLNWLTPQPIDSFGNQYVIWSTTASATGTATATTTKPIMGELREIIWAPADISSADVTTNTAVITTNVGWAYPNAGSIDTCASSDLYFTHTFGGTTAVEVYKNTADLVCRGYPVFNITNCLTSSGVGGQFRLIFIFAPEPDGLPAK